MSMKDCYVVSRSKQRLTSGQPVFSLVVFEFTRPAIVKFAAQAGLHMMLVEAEHEFHNERELTDFLVCCNDNGIDAVVSVPTHDQHFVSRIMDAGAAGVKLPHAETAEQVNELAQWVKYPPTGKRAMVYGPNTDFEVPDVARYCREANDTSLIILKIESRLGVENAEAMFDTGWVDGIVFGPVDLTCDWGVPGEVDHPEIVEAMDRVSRIAIERTIAVIGNASDRKAYEESRRRGAQLFAIPTELELIRDGILAFMKNVEE